MSETKYKLCKRAGLNITKRTDVYPAHTDIVDVIRAADVEKMLEGAPEVYGVFDNGKPCCWSYVCDTEGSKDTHAARLIMIEPIVKDTAESLLREIVQDHEALCRFQGKESEWELYKRARRLLEGK